MGAPSGHCTALSPLAGVLCASLAGVLCVHWQATAATSVVGKGCNPPSLAAAAASKAVAQMLHQQQWRHPDAVHICGCNIITNTVLNHVCILTCLGTAQSIPSIECDASSRVPVEPHTQSCFLFAVGSWDGLLQCVLGAVQGYVGASSIYVCRAVLVEQGCLCLVLAYPVSRACLILFVACCICLGRG
jgi:hypothetical protein